MITDVHPCARCKKTIYDRKALIRDMINGPMAYNKDQADETLEPACECTVLELLKFQNQNTLPIPAGSLILVEQEFPK